jgi:hypothetical protein
MAEGQVCRAQICQALVRWAKAEYQVEPWEDYYYEVDNPVPTVEVVSLIYDSDMDEWEAELSISTCVDNPQVRFYFEGKRLRVVGVEY